MPFSFPRCARTSRARHDLAHGRAPRRPRALACRIYQSRLDRSRFFSWAIFGDASWDMLLAIYVFAAAGRTLSAGELCQSTCESSLTTALRHQRRLVDLGLVTRVGQPQDRRRLLVELTDEGTAKLEAYLDHLIDTHFAVQPTPGSGDPRALCLDDEAPRAARG